MTLQEALDRIDRLGDDDVIFARQPWTLDADAEIAPLDADLRVPASITARGLTYFLEAPTAQEVLEVFGNREPTAEQRRRLLMFYAENDAYPDWVFEA